MGDGWVRWEIPPLPRTNRRSQTGDVKDMIDTTSPEIAEWITAQVRQYPGCENFKIEGVLSKEPDVQGCNWTVGTALVTGIDRRVWEPALNKVLAEARKSFNLKPA